LPDASKTGSIPEFPPGSGWGAGGLGDWEAENHNAVDKNCKLLVETNMFPLFLVTPFRGLLQFYDIRRIVAHEPGLEPRSAPFRHRFPNPCPSCLS